MNTTTPCTCQPGKTCTSTASCAAARAVEFGAPQMSHTEQMRELIAAAKEVVRISDRKHEAWDRLKAAITWNEGALTAPAAEVPEAMGDEPALPEASAWWIPKAEQFALAQHGERPFAKAWEPLHTADDLRAYAKTYAQWQSTRLRAAVPSVPEGWTDADSDAARLALELECLLMDTKDTAAVSRWWASANEALELHRQRMFAAPPAPEDGREVVRDAERWKFARSLLAVEDIEHAFEGLRAFGWSTDENECLKADAAIDAAMSAAQAGGGA